ncbi:MAG TPA: hypothetical protein VKP03_02060 [Patescibacteria group bacterium]|nr:hypothetical protein [Patescibacteria group bacterium]
MQEDKWLDLLAKVEKQFGFEEKEKQPHPEIEKAEIETVVFESPLGKMKLVRTVKPKVVDRQTIYANRPGSETRVDYKYSDDEFVDELEVFKWNDLQEDWQPADLNL